MKKLLIFKLLLINIFSFGSEAGERIKTAKAIIDIMNSNVSVYNAILASYQEYFNIKEEEFQNILLAFINREEENIYCDTDFSENINTEKDDLMEFVYLSMPFENVNTKVWDNREKINGLNCLFLQDRLLTTKVLSSFKLKDKQKMKDSELYIYYEKVLERFGGKTPKKKSKQESKIIEIERFKG